MTATVTRTCREEATAVIAGRPPRGREGEREEVQKDGVLTLDACGRSVVKGEAGGDGNCTRRPADGGEEDEAELAIGGAPA